LELLLHQTHGARLLLIDIEQSKEHQHGFAQHGSGYADLASCRRFLTSNGVPDADIATCNPRNQPLPPGEFDLLISLLSMGFHYPCDEYTNFILTGLRSGGSLILDKRTGSTDTGWDTLKSHFKVLTQAVDAKSVRLVLEKI
jgi:hypothetical protein